MTLTPSRSATENAAGKDGADLTFSTTQQSVIFGTNAGWSSSVWNFPNDVLYLGKTLPTLKDNEQDPAPSLAMPT